MLMNLRNALMTGKRLPYDAEVEYLESTRTQWIEIGMTFDARCVLDMTFQFTRFVGTATCHGQTTTASSDSARFAFGKGSASWGDWYCGIGNKSYRTGTALDLAVHRFVVDAPGDKFVIDDTTYNVGWTSFEVPSNPNSAMLYNRARLDSANLDTSGVYGKLYSCKIWQNGVLVRDFIPARKGTVGYLYDRVTGKLFGNAGTGDFQYGPDVVPVEYIESHGTEYIDTGVVPNDAIRIASTAYVSDYSSSTYIVYAGCYDTASNSISLFLGRSATARFGGGSLTNVVVPLDKALDISADRSGLTIDGVASTWGGSVGTFSNGKTMFLMGRNGGSDYGGFKGRSLGAKIYFNDILVRSFLPVRVGTEGAMMDVLTRRIYRNAGTGAFGYGNDLKYPIPA